MEKKSVVRHPSGLLLKDIIFPANVGIIIMLVLIVGLGSALINTRTIITVGLVETFLGAIVISFRSSFQRGFMIFFSYIIASLIPLAPFFYIPSNTAVVIASLFNGFVLLFILGIGKAHFTGKTMVRSALEVVIIGCIAVLLAYGIGHYLGLLVGS